MTLTDTTAKAQTEAISLEFDLKHPPEKVWRALTDPALVAQWLLPIAGNALDVERGSSFTFKTQPHGEWDGTVQCRFVEIEPQRKLSYSWDVDAMGLNTIVTFTIAPTATGTHMTLVQSGFKPEQKQNSGGARYGWKMMGGKLIDLLERIP
jgi:uncharacterized protein YndB with AHSA1/START domain